MYRKDDFMKEYSKSLGDIEARLLSSLAAQDRAVFTLPEAQEAAGVSDYAIRLILSGLVKKKWLIRLMKGKYLIIPFEAGTEGEHTENWFVIAKNLIEPEPYYISHYSALDIHEMVTQPVMTIYISTPIRRITKQILGAAFRFVFVQPKDLWGFEDVWLTQSTRVKTSDIEITILDCIDRPDLCGRLSEVPNASWTKRNDLYYQQLAEYAKRHKKKSVIKRLGFLLETYSLGSEEILSELRNEITKSYALLDPSLPVSGRYKSSWRVTVNIDPQELMETTKT